MWRWSSFGSQTGRPRSKQKQRNVSFWKGCWNMILPSKRGKNRQERLYPLVFQGNETLQPGETPSFRTCESSVLLCEAQWFELPRELDHCWARFHFPFFFWSLASRTWYWSCWKRTDLWSDLPSMSSMWSRFIQGLSLKGAGRGCLLFRGWHCVEAWNPTADKLRKALEKEKRRQKRLGLMLEIFRVRAFKVLVSVGFLFLHRL